MQIEFRRITSPVVGKCYITKMGLITWYPGTTNVDEAVFYNIGFLSGFSMQVVNDKPCVCAPFSESDFCVDIEHMIRSAVSNPFSDTCMTVCNKRTGIDFTESLAGEVPCRSFAQAARDFIIRNNLPIISRDDTPSAKKGTARNVRSADVSASQGFVSSVDYGGLYTVRQRSGSDCIAVYLGYRYGDPSKLVWWKPSLGVKATDISSELFFNEYNSGTITFITTSSNPDIVKARVLFVTLLTIPSGEACNKRLPPIKGLPFDMLRQEKLIG